MQSNPLIINAISISLYIPFQGRSQDFDLGGGGAKDYVRAHNKSAKREVPDGRGPIS